MSPPTQQEDAAVYRDKILDEIGYALGTGRSGVIRRLLGLLFRRPAARFGLIAAHADAESEFSGISGGARRVLPDLLLTVSARGTELIPPDGPLLIVSNHPGALDSLALLSCIPRKDTKVLISDVAFTRSFSAARRYFIYVPPEAGGRTAALRASIEHLQKGGSLLVFAYGDVEPDPEVSPGARDSIQRWPRSVAIMLRSAPESWLQAAIVSGVLDRRFFRNPIVKIRRSPVRQQKLAEVLQLSRQMIFGRSVHTHVHVSFAKPVKATNLLREQAMTGVIGIACRLLEDHLLSWRIQPPCSRPAHKAKR
jgi:1-acyl-sn-glycerol-3-phosphate acyltransferase